MFTRTQTTLAILVALLLVIPAAPLLAQTLTSGDVTGTVTDPTGAVIAGAHVTINSVATGVSHAVDTDSSGVYRFSLLAPGSYTVSVEFKGFASRQLHVQVGVGQVATADAHMAVSSQGTEVTVTEEVPLVNSEVADNTTTLDSRMVDVLPNGGGDLTYLAQGTPGAVMNTSGGFGNFNVNGLPATSNVFTVDGENQMDPFLNLNNSGPTNLMLGKNSIAEATVVTNAYGGQYGQQAGAQVNYVSKGGTNQFHGNANYQWNGDALNANDWFNNRGGAGPNPGSPVDKPFAINNSWQASVGGPIRKDKTFFFIDTEGVRYTVSASAPVYSPSSAFAGDVMANLGVVGASPATQAAYSNLFNLYQKAPNYANGVPVPGSCVDTIFNQDISTVPGFTNLNNGGASSGCLSTYQTTAAEPADEWLLIGRIDENFGINDRAFFRFDVDRGTQATFADPINPAFNSASFQPAYNGNITYTHNFGASATNQFIFGASYYSAIFNEVSDPQSAFPTTDQTCQNTSFSLFGCTFTLFGEGNGRFTALNGFGAAGPQGRNVSQYQAVDDFAKTLGKHNLKFGVNFRRYDITDFDHFSGAAGGILGMPLVESTLTDFIQGQADVFIAQNALHPSAPMNTGGVGLYAQDEWAITSRFKLTLGLRLEHNFNPTCDTNCFANLNGGFSDLAGLPATTPYNQLISAGLNHAFTSIDAINAAPRLGFTWSPTTTGKTVVSGGIGIFYDAFESAIADNVSSNIPYSVSAELLSPAFGGAAPLFWGDPSSAPTTFANGVSTIRSGFAAGLSASGLPAGFIPDVSVPVGTIHTPQYQEWNFGVQQALDSKSSLMINYVGNHGIHEAYPNANANAATVTGVPGFPAVSPDPSFGAVTQFYTAANSNYNGLTATYNRRMTAGFVISASFTWAHALDEISNGGLLPYAASGSVLGQINPAGLALNNYGNADYDVRHSFNANYVWTEPFKFSNPIARGILGGWMVSENFFARSGLPLTVTDNSAVLVNGGTTVLAQPVGLGQQACVNGNSQCLNPADFISANGLASYSTQMRNQYRGPGFFDSDVSVGKQFHLTEGIKLDLGANLYNIFNHQSFRNPVSGWTTSACGATGVVSGQCTASAFGQIQTVAAPPTGIYGAFLAGLPDGRIVQLQAKINF